MLQVVLLTLGDPDKLTGGYLFHRRLADLAHRHDAHVEFASLPERPFPLSLVDGPKVLRAITRNRPDVVVLDSIAAAFLAPELAIRAPPIPVLGMLHQPPGGIDHGPPRSTVQAWLDRIAYSRARRLLVASESLFDQLIGEGVPIDRMRVVPPGRDVAQSGPVPQRLDMRQGRRVAFLCVGNWVARKGIHLLVDAFAQLPAHSGTLHLVGRTDVERAYGRRLQLRLERGGVAGKIIVHGPLPKEQVALLYRSADVFVLPSLKEPYGTVWGEAMAEGLPVVGWALGNLPYLATSGKEGLLLRPGDLRGLTDALLLLSNDEGLRRRMGKAGALRAATRPTWDETARLFFHFVREVL